MRGKCDMKIKILKEVHSKKQRKFFCASDDPKLNDMCDDPMKEEQLDETSGAAGVAGYAGSPLGSKEDNEDFNKKQKEDSKLKGKRLAEMFGSSTQTGGVRISIVPAEKEHAGHVERSQHQGLRNVMMEADDDATLPMDDSTRPLPDAKPLPKPRDPVEEMLEKNGYKLKKKLGEGQYGVVVLATEIDEYGGHDFAIKILKKTGGEAIAREIRNYSDISTARDKDPQIAKHFPEVFDIFEEDENTFIVMEVLEPLQAELKGIFSGVEQVMHKQRPMSAPGWAISKFDDDKDVSKRVEMMMSDEAQIKHILRMIKGQLETFSSEFNAKLSDGAKKDIDIALASTSFRNILGVDKKKGSSILNNLRDQIQGYLGGAYKIYDAILDDLKKSYPASIFVTLVCKKIIDIMKKHTQHPSNPDDSYNPEEGIKSNAEYIIQSFLERFQKHYRMSTSLKGGYSQADVGKDGGRLGDAESIYQAIMKLQDVTGLFARDLHDANAMRRPGGDIVIVDVGMFKTDTEIKQMKKGKLRENRIRIKIKH